MGRFVPAGSSGHHRGSDNVAEPLGSDNVAEKSQRGYKQQATDNVAALVSHLQRRRRPQYVHLRSEMLPGAPVGVVTALDEGFCLEVARAS